MNKSLINGTKYVYLHQSVKPIKVKKNGTNSQPCCRQSPLMLVSLKFTLHETGVY
jgi:hypothetical protein